MTIRVYAKVNVQSIDIEIGNKDPGYLRVFKNYQSAPMLILIEQLTILKQISMLLSIYNFLEKNPFHQNDCLKIYYYRHTMYHFRCLISKLQIGLSPHLAIKLFYIKISPCIKGFELMYHVFKIQIFEKAGFQFISKSYKTNYQNTIIGKGQKDLIFIETENLQYGFINQDGEIEYEDIQQSINLKQCSICLIKKPNLANNLFCSHRYCIHCLNTYFKNKYSIICPKIGCNAKVIRRLINIKNQNSRSNSLDRKQKQQIKKEPIEYGGDALLIDPEWPPEFKGNHIPNYIESQYIQLRKIIKYQMDKQFQTIQQIINIKTLCSQCLMTLEQPLLKAQCNQHFICLLCTFKQQDQCLLC